MSNVSDLGPVRRTDKSDLFQLALDEIVHFLVTYVRIDPRIVLLRAAGTPGNNSDLLSGLLDVQSTSTVSLARILSTFGHAGADHTRGYFVRRNIEFLARLTADDHNFDRTEQISVCAFLHRIKKKIY